MKNLTFIFLFFYITLFSGHVLFAQEKTPKQLFEEGVRAYEAASFESAAATFIKVSGQKFNPYTTPSIYMAGLSYLKAGDDEAAMSKFHFLVTAYSSSIYVDEANYHKVLLLFKKKENWKSGVFLATKLMDETKNADIKSDALELYKKFLFEKADADFLKEYYGYVKNEYKETVLEALCYRLYQAKAVESLNQYLTSYQKANGGNLSERLKKFLNAEVAAKPEGGELRIAVALPFQSRLQDTTLSLVSRMSVEMMEGMRLAAEGEAYPKIPKVEIKFFDTNKNTDETHRLLRDEIQKFNPQFIIGELFNNQSKVIADFAERNKIVQVVPLSSSMELIDGRKQVFLANASLKTQVEALANYVDTKLHLKNILVVSDFTPNSQSMSRIFTETVKNLGGKVTQKTVSGTDNGSKTTLRELSKQLKDNQFDAVYLPVADEELVSVTLGFFNRDSVVTQLLGTSDWAYFRNIDRMLLSRLGAIFPDTYYEMNDEANYNDFRSRYFTANQRKPSVYVAQGYDIMRFILSNYAQASSPMDCFRRAKPYRGIGQNFYFNQANDNQSVQILQFSDFDIVKVKLW